ncbi:unnamed protein product [Rotaria sordida]|uniref:Uncharacterized protein n=2 Tax=Rotaria sordida TaxID=392033 RepID=A0A814KX60_9BILA
MTDLALNETQMDNDDRPIDVHHDNATNVFLTQGVNTTQHESSSDSRSNASMSDVPKLPQITATATT